MSGGPFVQGLYKVLAKGVTPFLRFVADRASAADCFAYLLEEALSKGFERLPHSPASAVRAEQRSRFSLYRLAGLVPQIHIVEEGLDRAGDV